MKAEVELTKCDGVAIISLQAPQRRNALTPAMAEDLTRAIEEVDADESVGAAVLYGSGGYFCAGADLTTLESSSNDPALPESFDIVGGLYAAFVRFGKVSVPTVAAVEGGAVGAGVNLMMAADLRIVAEDATIMSGFSRLQLHPGGGHFSLLNSYGGRELAAAVGIFGDAMDGRGCVERGLAWQCVPSYDVIATAMAYARRVAEDPVLARKAVESLRLTVGPPSLSWEAALRVERSVQMWSMRRRKNDG